MHHSTCSSTSSLVFMVLVLLLRAVIPVVPLIPTFISSSLLTCPSTPLVVNNIGICRTPIITGKMANYVALVAFGSTWTIMVIVAFRTQRLISAVMFLLPMPCNVSSASILPLVRWLLVLIVLRSVIQLPLVLSLAFSAGSLIPSSSRCFTILDYVANLLAISTLYSARTIMVKFALVAQSDLIFFGGGNTDGGSDDEGSAVVNSVMHALANGDRGLEGTGSSVGTAEGSARASQQGSILGVEADPPLVPLAPHQKLTGISMARN
ncbi:hypothetical protein Tco_0709326 [Tanacetum coccineum]